MCSFIGQILYGVVMAAALGLTLGSMFTSEWRKITGTGKGDGSGGLFDIKCKVENLDECKRIFDNHETWEKAVIIAMIVAVVLEVLAVAWTIFTFFACCCRRKMLHPFSGFALCAAIALIVALALYFTHYKDQIGGLPDVQDLKDKANVGYSFYLGCGALAANLIGIVVGAMTSCLTKEK